MRFIRYQKKGEAPGFGWLLDDQVGAVEGSPFGEFRRLETRETLQTIRLLAPTQPSKIICVGRNYAAHAREHQADIPQSPLIFLKPPSSIIAPGEPIIIPPQSNQVEHEAELAVVIGKRSRWILPENALAHVLGYTIGNDVTARDLQNLDQQWTRSKGFDTFCPLGPWIETEFDPSDVVITCYVNDEMRQMASTRDMVFNVPNLIAYISSIMTLEAGDVILTGTPAGVSPLKSGDQVKITIEGLGSLENPVFDSESAPRL